MKKKCVKNNTYRSVFIIIKKRFLFQFFGACAVVPGFLFAAAACSYEAKQQPKDLVSNRDTYNNDGCIKVCLLDIVNVALFVMYISV